MKKDYIEETKRWLKEFVIQHQLCPFAKQPFVAQTIKYRLIESTDMQPLLLAFLEEIDLLKKTSSDILETTLLIFPNLLTDFLDYNEALPYFDQLLDDLQMRGIFQLASFHPQYQFADTTPNAVENKTNQSPYPMLHVLREKSVEKAVQHYPDAALIPERNMQKMRELFSKTL